MGGNIRSGLLLAALATGCGFDVSGSEAGDDVPGRDAGTVLPSFVEVRGEVLGFTSRAPVEAVAQIEELGVKFRLEISVDGSSFTIRGVPRQSLLLIQAGAPGYRPTLNPPIVVADGDLTGVQVFAVSEAYALEMASAFGMTDSSTMVMAQVQNTEGLPFADIEKGVFEMATESAAEGPFLLDGNLRPEANLLTTSSSGYVVFSGVTGDVSIKAREGRGYHVEGPGVEVATGQVALLRLLASPGELALPSNVGLGADIVPIFEARGCTQCHTKSGIGKELGGLSLDGGLNHVLEELATEVSPRSGIVRVNLNDPRISLLLSRPNAEFPPDVHPYTTFNGVLDDDYLTILSWIAEGADAI